MEYVPYLKNILSDSNNTYMKHITSYDISDITRAYSNIIKEINNDIFS